MNFKEIYMSANDEIHGDSALIEKIMQKAQKKSSSKMIYSFACVAVTLAIVAIISLQPGNPETVEQPIQVVSNKDASETNVDDTQKAVSKTDETTEEYRYLYKEKTATENSIQESEKAENDFDSFSPAEESAQITDSSENYNVMTDANDTVSSSGANKFMNPGSGGGGSSMGNISYEGITAEQYNDYIGADIIKKIVLPDGVRFEPFYGAVLKRDSVTGETVSDEAEFYASGSGKKLSISTTKLLGEVYNKLNNSETEKTDISGTIAIIENYETSYNAYVEFSNVYYKVNAVGFTNEEIQNLLLSICSN